MGDTTAGAVSDAPLSFVSAPQPTTPKLQAMAATSRAREIVPPTTVTVARRRVDTAHTSGSYSPTCLSIARAPLRVPSMP